MASVTTEECRARTENIEEQLSRVETKLDEISARMFRDNGTKSVQTRLREHDIAIGGIQRVGKWILVFVSVIVGNALWDRVSPLVGRIIDIIQ